MNFMKTVRADVKEWRQDFKDWLTIHYWFTWKMYAHFGMLDGDED